MKKMKLLQKYAFEHKKALTLGICSHNIFCKNLELKYGFEYKYLTNILNNK